MIEETGQVITIDGSWATVTTKKQYGSCTNCSGGGCGTALTMRLLQPQHTELRVSNPIGASTGEQVVIGVTEDSFMRAAALLYGIPLLTLIFGVVTGQWLGTHWVIVDINLISLLGGMLGLMVGLGCLWYLTIFNGTNTICPATILRRSGESRVISYPHTNTLL